MNYSTSDPFFVIYEAGVAITNALHPAPLTVEILMDPFNTSSSDASYERQMQVIQGVCFGLAFLLLAVSLIFLMVRVMWNGFGGQEPSKFGYSTAAIWTTKISYFLFAILLVTCVSFGFVGNSRLGNGIGKVSKVFQDSLPPLSPRQVTHMDRVIDKNKDLIHSLHGDLQRNLDTTFSQFVSANLTPSAGSLNFSSSVNVTQLSSVMVNISSIVKSMRNYRVMAESVLVRVVELRNSSVNTSIYTDVVTITDQMQNYYNFSEIDLTMSQIIAPLKGVDFSDLAAAVQDQTRPSEYFKAISTRAQLLQTNLDVLFNSLGYGAFQCELAIDSGRFVSNGTEGMVKFSHLIEMLTPINNAAVPILYVFGVVFLVAAIVGAVAFPTKSHHLMYPATTMLVMAAVAAWALTGFILPVTFLTSDSCAQPELFTNSMLSSVPNQPYGLDRSALNIPSCAACEKENVYLNWPKFLSNAKNISDATFSVEQALSVPYKDGSSGALYPALVSAVQMEKVLVTTVAEPTAASPWKSKLDTLTASKQVTSNSTNANTPAELAQLGYELQRNTILMYNDFVRFVQNAALTSPAASELKKTLDANNLAYAAALNTLYTHMSSSLGNIENQYVTVPQAAGASCIALASAMEVDPLLYEKFREALCGDTVVGMETTWLFLVASALLAGPLIVTTIVSYKHISFAQYFQSEYRAY